MRTAAKIRGFTGNTENEEAGVSWQKIQINAKNVKNSKYAKDPFQIPSKDLQLHIQTTKDCYLQILSNPSEKSLDLNQSPKKCTKWEQSQNIEIYTELFHASIPI